LLFPPRRETELVFIGSASHGSCPHGPFSTHPYLALTIEELATLPSQEGYRIVGFHFHGSCPHGPFSTHPYRALTIEKLIALPSQEGKNDIRVL